MPHKNAPLPIVVDAASLHIARTGIGHYTAEITKHLSLYGLPTIALLSPHDAPGTDNKDLEVSGVTLVRSHLWTQNARNAQRVLLKATSLFMLPPVPLERLTGPARAILFPAYRTVPTRAPALTTIHDLTNELYPQYQNPRANKRHLQRVREAIETSSLLLTDSNTVAGELHDVYGVTTDRISVVGICPPDLPEPTITYPGVVGAVLSVSVLDKRKNIPRLIEAYSKLSDITRKEHPLIIVGPPGYGAEEIITKASLVDNVHVLGRVSPGALASIYNQASLLVHPAIYEGFGLPVVEALRAALPMVLSDIPVMHEVSDNLAAAYFDPTDVDAIANSILIGLTHSSISYKVAAPESALRYSWDIAAAKLSNAIDRVAPL